MTIAVTYSRNQACIVRVAAIILTVSMMSGCEAPVSLKDSSEAPTTSLQKEIPGLPNFMQVSETLYRGGQPTDIGYDAVRQMGIRSIVTLRVLDQPSEERRHNGFRVFHISVKHIHPETEDVLEFLSIATNPENQPVFVHCQEGVDRTGMMVAVYRMVVQNWPKDKAINEMKQAGFNEWNVPIEHYLQDLNVEELKNTLRENKRHPYENE